MSVCRPPSILLLLAVVVGMLAGCPCRVDTSEAIRREMESRAPAWGNGQVTVAYTRDLPEPDGVEPGETSLLLPADTGLGDACLPEPAGMEPIVAPLPMSTGAELDETPQPEPAAAEPVGLPLPELHDQPAVPLGDLPVPLLSESDQMALVNDIRALRDGLDELRRKVAFLEHNAQVVTTGTVARLTEENRQLRRELQRLYTGGGTTGGTPGARAGGFLAGPESADRDAGYPEPDLPPPPVMAVAGNPRGDLPYSVVKEWGVSPGEAAKNPGAMSSKGMVCAVPPSATEEDLRLFAARLRDEHGMYDRYTIDVFDDPEAARRYVEENALPGLRRVLSVVKDPATGRDGAVMFRNGEEVGLTAE